MKFVKAQFVVCRVCGSVKTEGNICLKCGRIQKSK